MTDNDSNSTVDRRIVLRTATAGLALSGLGQTVVAQATPTGKSVQFSEVRLSHRLSLPDEPNVHYPSMSVDEFSTTHLVDPTRSKLYVNEDQDRGIGIANQDAVVASDGYSSMPTELGGSSQSAITTGLHKDYRASSALELKNEYTQPQISVSERAGGLAVAAEGQDITVPSRGEQVLSLPEQEVTVEVFEYADEKPPERDDHRPAAPVRNYRDVQVTITPEVHARNHGELEVATVSTPAPVPQPPEPQN